MSIRTNYKQYFDVSFVYSKNSFLKKLLKGTEVSHYTLYTTCTLSDGTLVMYADQVKELTFKKESENISKILTKEIGEARKLPTSGRPYEHELEKIKVSKSTLIVGDLI